MEKGDETMKVERRWFITVFIVLLPLLLVGITRGDQEETKFQWVIGSAASALANDSSKITLTGTGTFKPNDPEEVTGGGTWQTFNPGATTPNASGTFKVTRLVKVDLTPSVPDPSIRGGLAFFRIKYSDGNRGILVVSCRVGAPAPVFEGVTASKDFTDYWSRIPAGTLFRVVTEPED
jgi:hypothetical protein